MRLSIVLFLVSLLPRLALAHHGGSEYDMTKTVEFKAKLTRVEMINPHSWIYFDVTESDGKISHHRCEMRSVHVLRRSGWTKENFPVGQQITVEASPNRTDPASCYLQTIVAADGTRMDRYGQYVKAPQGGIQEVRGPIAAPKTDRPLRRPSGEPNISGDWAPVQLVMANARGTGGGLLPLDKLAEYKPGDRPAVPQFPVYQTQDLDNGLLVAGPGVAKAGRVRCGGTAAERGIRVGEGGQRSGRHRGLVQAAGDLPAERAVYRQRRRIQGGHRVPAPLDLGQQFGHDRPADPAAALLGRYLDAGHPGHRHRPAMPPLLHAEIPGAGDQSVPVEGTKDLACVDAGLDAGLPPRPVGRRNSPEGPAAEGELRLEIVAGVERADLQTASRHRLAHRVRLVTPASP